MSPNNQMNSMYKSPLKQSGHKSSVLALIIFLVIAIAVAVLGFGRIKTIKQEEAQAEAMRARQMNMRPQVRKEPETDVFTEIDATLDSNYASGTDELDAEFR